jgi:hypothetical protein
VQTPTLDIQIQMVYGVISPYHIRGQIGIAGHQGIDCQSDHCIRTGRHLEHLFLQDAQFLLEMSPHTYHLISTFFA